MRTNKSIILLVLLLSLSLVFTVNAWAEDEGGREGARRERISAGGEAGEEEGEKGSWMQRVSISGEVEVEASHSKLDDETEDDILAAEVELGIEGEINELVEAEVWLLWEEDESEDVELDVATITIGPGQDVPVYMTGGKYYLHFGELNTYMVSDPITLEIAEINQSALKVGAVHEWVSGSLNVFNGDVNEESDEDEEINGFMVEANVHNPEGSLGDVQFRTGVAWISDIADSEGLEEELADEAVESLVSGAAAYLIVDYRMFSFSAEYITSLDEFEEGELEFAVDADGEEQAAEPAAYNVEFAVRPVEDLQLALRYEGSKDLFDFMPESRYGITVSYDVLEDTRISAEFLMGQYDDDNASGTEDEDTFTVQVEVEF